MREPRLLPARKGWEHTLAVRVSGGASRFLPIDKAGTLIAAALRRKLDVEVTGEWWHNHDTGERVHVRPLPVYSERGMRANRRIV